MAGGRAQPLNTCPGVQVPLSNGGPTGCTWVCRRSIEAGLIERSNSIQLSIASIIVYLSTSSYLFTCGSRPKMRVSPRHTAPTQTPLFCHGCCAPCHSGPTEKSFLFRAQRHNGFSEKRFLSRGFMWIRWVHVPFEVSAFACLVYGCACWNAFAFGFAGSGIA